MTYKKAMSLLKKAIDNVSKAIDNASKALDKFYEEIPQYLRREMLHPKKKPRGSIRRARQRRDAEWQEKKQQKD